MKEKYIIGLGCSWTQGEGGYPQEVVDAHNGRTNLDPGNQTSLIQIIIYVNMS